MNIEYEAKFLEVDTVIFIGKLKELGGTKVHDCFLQTRAEFNSPLDAKGAYVRVRKEYGKTTLTHKIHDANEIDGARESEVEINNFDTGVALLESMGIICRSIKENYREKWLFNNAEVYIDESPYLDVYIEIEGDSKEHVLQTAKLLNINDKPQTSDTNAALYAEKYNIEQDVVFNVPRLLFNEPNPFT